MKDYNMRSFLRFAAWMALCISFPLAARAQFSGPGITIGTGPGTAVGNEQKGAQNGVAPQDSDGTITTRTVKPSGASTALSLGALLGQVVNAASLGLVCDNSTDNAAAIGRINAVTTGTVFFPPAASKCLTSVALSPRNGVTLYAYPGTVTIAPTAGNVAGQVLFSAIQVQGTAYGLTFDGGGQDFANSNTVVLGYQTNGYTWDRIAVQNTRGIGLLCSDCVNSGVQNSVFAHVGNHWKTTLSASDRQQAIVFSGDPGTEFSNTGGFIRDNTFTDVGLDAISVATISAMQVRGNKCFLANGQIASMPGLSAYPACVYANGVDGLQVVDNYSTGAPGNGYDITATNFIVAGNTALKNGSNGMLLYASSQGSVSNNTLNGNNQYTAVAASGLALGGGATDVNVTGNVSTDTQATKTQKTGFSTDTATYTRVWVDQSNNFDGNATGRFAAGGSITAYSTTR